MRFRRSMWSYFSIFLLVAGVATGSVLVYDAINKTTDNAVTIIVTTCVIFALALVCTIVDILRRKYTVEIPVANILEATKEIARGNLSVRLTPRHTYKRYDQYDLIIEDINDMAKQLSKAETMKTDFVSNVSHELKTPLAILQNYAHALKGKNLDEATRDKYLDEIECASKRMTTLVTNILNLNKLENQQLAPERTSFNLQELLINCVLGFEEIIDGKHLEPICDFEDITIVSSAGYLELIFNNLLSNAIKFSEEGGKIVLTLKRIGEFAVIGVQDFGLGMSHETGMHIFDRFYQGDTSHAQEGNGLGLAIVKRVIDLLGGEISVESKLGEGSKFTVKLRLSD
ncbi:MAG: HAMP domain-containing histidine kinase [Bacteroides sp.]|nr:HAMP domain-containing histidine kinase [Bacillota bacterium]MCM1394053.1 HAMP domain-containing histidine kinase [[Eubacterium] siraeum]MCM1455505.1 HAMP domain-containing histidine kinase [Bacteroides sp.]